MRRILPIAILCLLAVATTGCKKAQLRRQLKELMGSTIVLPEKISCVYNGEVYPMPDSLRDKPKLIIYIDSTECSLCSISRFVNYEPVFEFAYKSGLFETIILLSPKSQESHIIQDYLLSYNFSHPVYMDSEHMYKNSNPNISTEMFHCLLINSLGYPVFVGDPSDSAIKDLMFNSINTFEL